MIKKLLKVFFWWDDKIVPRNTYFPDISSAPKDIQKSYQFIRSKLKKWEYFDVGENLSYLFAYIYEVINDFAHSSDIETLEKEFDILRKNYKDTKIVRYLDSWQEEAYLYLGEHKKAWEYAQKHSYSGIEDILYYWRNIWSSIELSWKKFLSIFGKSSLTKLGKENLDDIEKLVGLFLSDFHIENWMNFIDYFCKDIGKDITEDDLKSYLCFFDNEEEFNEYIWYDKWQFEFQHKTESDHIGVYKKELFNGIVRIPKTEVFKQEGFTVTVTSSESVKATHEVEAIQLGIFFNKAISNYAKKTIRECENTYREEAGIPKIWEGWVSETQLYHRISKEFPEINIKHHWRPSWLWRQHLDIYIPDHNIWIEYQGKQHQEPVEYFGWKEAFKKQQARDKKKQKKCKDNNCHLIYVYEWYDFREIAKSISTIIQSQNNNE